MAEKSGLVIVNRFDRPSEIMLAMPAPGLGGRLRYVHPHLVGNACYFKGMDATEATPVEDFGVDVAIGNGIVRGTRSGPSRAEYENGHVRKWQGGESFVFPLPYMGEPPWTAEPEAGLGVRLHRACEEIDASVFSGDVLERADAKAELAEYVRRWWDVLTGAGE